MESAKARLSQIGSAVRDALDSECDPTNDLRVARAALLHAVTHAPPPRKPRGTWSLLFDPRVVVAFAAPVAAAAAWLFWATRPISFTVQSGSEARVGDLVEAAGTPVPLSFSEGSSVVLKEGGRARVLAADANGARVLLEAGEADISIQHRVGRKARWNVEAGPYRVLVTGTRFRVGWSPAAQAFKLELHAGSVVVSSARCLDGERIVHAGQALKLSCASPAEAAASSTFEIASAAPAPALPSSSANRHGVDKAVHAAGTAGAERVALDAFRAPLEAGRFAEALSLAERANFERVIANASQSDLLQLADAARLSGRVERAIQALGAVRLRFAGSEEASTAAFSLGRIAFDQRRAYGEASRWFSTYLAEQPSGPLMGDAFGRLIEARERSGDLAGAQSDAERYLRRFPQGPYAAEARRILANAKE